jgi:hypothetical protein
VCRDVQLVRVEVSVLVSGRDEVGDAVHVFYYRPYRPDCKKNLRKVVIVSPCPARV